jgi:threonine dehydrogenase-like Zn-dependent dehydrogenase
MHAVLTYGPGDMRYEEIDTPKPGPGEVLVKVARVGMGINDPTIAEGHWPTRTDYMIFPENSIVHRLPAEISDGAAIALESTSCGIYTVERGGLRMGETVVVLGGGFLGLIMVQVCTITCAAAPSNSIQS